MEYISPFVIDKNNLKKIDGIIWKYDKGWSCRGNELINSLCKKYFSTFEKIDSNEGFWIYSYKEKNLKIDYNITQKKLFYNDGWNLSGNSSDKPIFFDNRYLVWKYDKNIWQCSYNKTIEIKPYKGFWIKTIK